KRMRSLQHQPHHYFQRPDAGHVSIDSARTSLTGWMGRVWLNKEKGNWRFNGAVGVINPNFEANDLGFHTKGDYINSHAYVAYLWFEPDPIFRTKSVSVAALREYNFGGVNIGTTFNTFLVGQFHNYWSASVYAGFNDLAYDDRRTRGGPLLRYLPSSFVMVFANTDYRKAITASLVTLRSMARSGGNEFSVSLNLNWKATPSLSLGLGPSVYVVHTPTQYITTRSDPGATETFGKQYIFTGLDQRVISATIRMNWSLTSRMSLQAYVQPYIAVGEYSGFKEFARPRTFHFLVYGKDGSTKVESNGTVLIDPDGPLGPRAPFTLPSERAFDFNYKSLRANLVLRWEFLPGSTLYAVWTNQKLNIENSGDLRFGRDFTTLLRHRPDNIFALKISYWIDP
ncbi:MAG: DUF5916 domain-containing protein, partial [Bacteroidota bacterium]